MCETKCRLASEASAICRRKCRDPALATAAPGDRMQFERVGYFCVDLDSKPGALVFDRTIGLKDSWAAKQAK